MSDTPVEKKLNTCGCCAEDKLRYPPHFNRPGRDSLDYRLATHAGFLQRMLACLTRNQLPDEPGIKDLRPLAKLTTRGAEDPAVALMDAWAIVADVLAFYQERIANEGFIRTATERRSVLELARAIGYELNPGVAAGAYLAFTAEKSPGMPETVKVPKGNRVLSLPRQDKLPQTFETVEEIIARKEWNRLEPYTPIDTIVDQIVFGMKELRLKGLNTGLRAGDAIAIAGGERHDNPGSERWDVRILQSVTPKPDKGYTLVTWERGLGHVWPKVLPAGQNVAVYAFRQRASVFGHNAPDWKSLDPEVKARYVPHGVEAVTSVAFSSDGTLALCSTVDSTIKLWRISTEKVIRAFYGHRGSVNSAVFAAADQHIISGGDDGTVRVWDVETGAAIKTFSEHVGPVLCVVIGQYTYLDPEDKKEKIKKYALSGGADGTVILWDLDTWKKKHKFTGHAGAVNSVACSPDGTQALSGGEDGTIRLWNVVTHVPVRSWSGHTCPVNCLAFSPDGTRALSGGDDKTAKLWNLGTGTMIRSFGHGQAVRCVAFRPKTNEVCSGGADGMLKMWNADTGFPISRAFAGHGSAVTGLMFTKNGNLLLSGSLDKTMKLWEADSGSLKKVLSGDTVERVVEWPGFAIPADPGKKTLDLDNLYPTIVPGSWIALMKPSYVELYGVKEAGVTWRTDFSLSAKVTRLRLDTVEHLSWFDRRETIVFYQSEPLDLYEEQVKRKDPIQGKTIEISSIQPKLETGCILAVSGKRMRARITIPEEQPLTLWSADGLSYAYLERGDELTVMSPPAPQSDGRRKWHLRDRNGFIGFVTAGSVEIAMAGPFKEDETVSEIAFIESVTVSGPSATDPLQLKRTIISLSAALQNIYDYDSVTINANVARATHGETVAREVLGSGEGTTTNQRFTLKKKPLTYVSAPTPSGGETTLEVRVNDVLWKEASSLYGLDGRSQRYIVRNDNEGNSTVTFGDGATGARLPTGQENVAVRYRSGIGPDGEVDALSLILLQDKPLGIRAVENPLPATGAAGPETLSEARANAPMTVQTLDRIVSIKDFQDFAASFAGVGKAQAKAIWNGEASFAHITIATASGNPVNESSDLYRNLARAMDRVRDTSAQVRIDTYTPRYFNVRAQALIDPRYLWDKVETGIRGSLLKMFSFAQRGFGQQVTKAEVVTAIQKVEGVMAVNVTELHHTPPPEPEPDQQLTDPLSAQQARWEENRVKLAELLLINPGTKGIRLEEMPS